MTNIFSTPLADVDETEFDAVVERRQGRVSRGLSLFELRDAAAKADEWLANVPLKDREGAYLDYLDHVVPMSYRGNVKGVGAQLVFKGGAWRIAWLGLEDVPHRSYGTRYPMSVWLKHPIDRSLVDPELRSKHRVKIPQPAKKNAAA